MVPSKWRKTKVTPSSKREYTGNYQPVSFTSLPEKVMEQIFLEVITKHVKEKVIKSSQFGYTKGKSCLTSLMAFCDTVAGSSTVRGAVDFVCLGFRAFDTVSCDILVGKLRKCTRGMDSEAEQELAECQSSEGQWSRIQLDACGL